MSDIPPTQQTLLLRLADGQDREAWKQFVEIYAPVVFQFARRRGLQDSDAADLTQDVLIRVADAFRRRRYDGSRGSFRGWLFTITRNELADWFDAHARREQAGGGTSAQQMLAHVADSEEVESWQREYEERLFAWAAERVRTEVRPATWDAFWQSTMDQRNVQEVAESLGMSVAAVYLAKSRLMKRLRELVRQVDDDAG